MKRSIAFFICQFIFIFSDPVNSKTTENRFTLTSPHCAISSISFDLQIQALKQNGQKDTCFTGFVHIEKLTQRINDKIIYIERIGPFINGKITVPGVVCKKSGIKTYILWENSDPFELKIRVIPGFLSLLPPVLAILLALVFRQVLISLFAGIWLGATFLLNYNPFTGLLRVLDHYITGSLADPDHVPIILFSMTLGGMVGILSRSGGTQGIIAKFTRLAENPRGGQLTTWIMGIFIFFDDYANTLIVGNTMRPVTDRLRISREKLAYIVDSTAAPVVSVAVFSTWIGFELGLIQDAFQQLGINQNIYLTYLRTIPYRFYCIFTLIFVLIVSILERDFGPMLKSEKRTRNTGKVLRDNSVPLTDKSFSQIAPPQGTPLRWFNAVIPILTVILVTLTGLWYNGRVNLSAQGIQNPSFKIIIGAADSLAVLMWSSFTGAFIAGLLAISQKILNLRQTLDAWFAGTKSMLLAMIILVFAWTIGRICEDLHTADYVVNITRGFLSPHFLPFITFTTAAFISFATGTSWGTMSILVPIVIPMAYKFSIEYSLAPEKSSAILVSTIASVLSGAVFGDHCSPISDTTIMSSMSSGADHIDHVRTQMPYALLVAAVAILIGYLPAGFSLQPVFSLVTGIILLTGFLILFGKKSKI